MNLNQIVSNFHFFCLVLRAGRVLANREERIRKLIDRAENGPKEVDGFFGFFLKFE